MSCVEIAEAVASAVTAGIRVLNFPGTPTPRLGIVAEGESPVADMAIAVGPIKNLRELFVCKGHKSLRYAFRQLQEIVRRRVVRDGLNEWIAIP